MQEFDLNQSPTEAPPHSKIGIAAFAVSLLGTLVFCIGFTIAFSIGFSSGMSGNTIDQASSQFRLATITMCGSVAINVIAVGLGIGSLFEPQKKKTFGIIGLVLSIVILCAFGALAILGLTQQ